MNMQQGFYQFVYRHECQFNEKREDLNDIESSVCNIVRELLDKVFENHPLISVTEIVPTGSYYEGTKVRIPDEFDYMAVLDPCVFATAMETEPGCGVSPWFQRIKVKDGEIPFTRAAVESVRNPITLEIDFWANISKVVETRPITLKTTFGTIATKLTRFHKLYLEYIQTNKFPHHIHDTTQTAIVSLNKIEVGVDIMLAFKHPHPEQILKNKYFPKQYEEDLLKYGCHLVTKSCHQTLDQTNKDGYAFSRCGCWFISFSAMETHLMKMMDDIHRQCYKVAKTLLIGNSDFPGKCMNLSSYMLKTAFLHHVYGKDGCKKSKYINCIPAILNDLEKGFKDISVPCFFARDFNVWGCVVSAPILTRDIQEKDISTKTAYAMLWIEFWRRIIMTVKEILSIDSLSKHSKWIDAIEKLGNFRAMVSFLLEEYFKSKQLTGSILVTAEKGNISTFDNVPQEIKEKFPTYIRDWKTIFNCVNFPIDRLVDVDIKTSVTSGLKPGYDLAATKILYNRGKTAGGSCD